MDLILLSSMFTFGNIWNRNRWRASRTSLRGETPLAASLLATHPPMVAHYTTSERSERCQVVQFIKCPQYKCTSACKKKRGAAERKTGPHGGLTIRRKFRIGFRNLCHFFRVKSIYLILLFLFSLFYIVYHRPSVKLKCSYIFLFI